MASSGDYDYNPSTFQIITGALRLIGAYQSGEVPPPEEYDDALAALNGLIHAWQVNNLHVWTQTTIDLPLVSGQTAYHIGIGSADLPTVPRPLKVTGGRLVIGSEEIPLIPMSRWDYANLSGKTTPPGPTVQYFYDPQLPYGILTVYPAPAATGLCRFVMQRPLQSFDTQRDTADIPQEWVSALRFNLAVELAPEYDVPAERLKILKDLADEKLGVVKQWDTEPGGTTTLPFSQPVYQLIAGALRLSGGCGPQDTPTIGLVNNGFYSLNAMVQQWQGMGIHLWTERDCILFLQPGQRTYRIGVGSPDHCCANDSWNQTYLTTAALGAATTLPVNSSSGITIGDHIAVVLDTQPGIQARYFWTLVTAIGTGTVTVAAPLPSQASAGARVVSYTDDLPRPLKVPAGRRMLYAGNLGYPTKIETPTTVYSRIDYSFVPNKDTPGEVTAYFFDPQLGFAEISVWPNPADTNQAFLFTAQMPLATFADLTTADNFPAEWQAALRWCLAVELWPEHYERRAQVLKNPQIGFQELKLMADEKFEMVRAWDKEPESVYFGVSNYPAPRNT